MGGNFFGGAVALLYFLMFQLCGVTFAACFLNKERRYTQMILGSAAGSVLLMWLPSLWAFLFSFSITAHVLALISLLLLTVGAVFLKRPKLLPNDFPGKHKALCRAERTLFLPLGLWLLFVFLVLHSFRYQNGEIWSSQCTYGDMSMHLGFITSIAEQKTFPPMYSILPGVKLSYPFLSDSISSSLYLLGAPLRFAYVLPMLFAGAQVFFGAHLFWQRWLRDKAKTALAEILFFLNGGFGFAYFFPNLQNGTDNFTRIFTSFYETPTNLVNQNIRWVNVIVDMLIPQRATLFGWAVLFPLLYVLYRAVYEHCERYFIIAGIFAGGLVMIHTHSFLAFGLICGVWLCFALCRRVFRGSSAHVQFTAKVAALVLMLLAFGAQFVTPKLIPRESSVFLYLVLVCAAAFVLFVLALLIMAIRKGFGIQLVKTWGVFLLITLLLAAPQLFTWTFSQASGDSFMRGWYNWGNLQDGYLWFYLVNLGVTALLFLPAFFTADQRRFTVCAPAAVIWFICEFVVFQPNTYDNNKLLYAAYFLVCGVVASYMVEIYRRLRTLPGRRALAVGALVLCMLSAVLTIGRESIAGYCLYGDSQLKAAEYIYENTEPEDTVLTDMRHNNEIAALTGRNIVCGSTSYVYFHGLDYTERETDMQSMFSAPQANGALFEKYSIDYILVSAYERNNFTVNEAEIKALFPCVFDENGVQIYKVTF